MIPALLFWLSLSVAMGYYANRMDRGAIKWFAISLLVSPVLGFAAINIIENGVEPSPRAEMNWRRQGGHDGERANPLSIEEFSKKVRDYKELRETEMIDEEEFRDVKKSLLKRLIHGIEDDSVEEVLFEAREMRDSGSLSEEDVHEIKSMVL
ncbi:hypothetical protein [Salinibacter ruber]|uniref:hypothetical protein n=1 Tax=Salinibacter ruber TaxID=146919 RepID=UPI0013E8F574|nr:hypothetical protein [Salinibacter ruber]MCS4101511.1 ribosomal protein L35 [Salinibacter ruber]